MRSQLLRFAIIIFCFFHMASIAIYALPPTATDPLTKVVRKELIPYVTPYIFMTSQWQRWNLFSPNPLRDVTEYIVEVQEGKTWRTVLLISPDSVPYIRQADELKILRRLKEQDRTDVRKRYLEVLCETIPAPSSARIRMSERTYTLPKNPPLSWKNFKPKWSKNVSASIICPAHIVLSSGLWH